MVTRGGDDARADGWAGHGRRCGQGRSCGDADGCSRGDADGRPCGDPDGPCGYVHGGRATPTAAEPKKAGLEGEMALMATECKLSPEQVAKLTEIDAAARAESEKWQKANADKLDAFTKARNAAAMANDQTAYLKAMEDIRPQMEEVRALRTKYQTQISDLLTADQKITWQSYMTWRTVTGELKQLVNLTDDQAAKIRPMCDAAAKDMAAIKDETETGIKARVTIQNDLLNKIRDTILTPEQKKTLEGMMAPPMPPAATGTAPAATATAPAATPTVAPKAAPAATPAATPTTAPKAGM